MIFVFVAHDLFFSRLLMTFECLMCLFPAHFFGGFSKDTHDCCISHVVICCSWVFSVCFLIGYSWFLSCSCAFCYSWCFFSCSWFFGLYTHVFLPLIGHSWLLSCSWFFFGYSWVLFCTWVAAHAWVPLYGQLLMSVFFAHEELLMHEYPSLWAAAHECFCTWAAAYAWVPLWAASHECLFFTWVAAHAWVPLYEQLLMMFCLHMSSCSCMISPIK